MPSLNQDVPFDIGQKLIENGDTEDVIRFGLSGKEPLKALGKLFAFITVSQLSYSFTVISVLICKIAAAEIFKDVTVNVQLRKSKNVSKSVCGLKFSVPYSGVS
uniref:Uncharacterized protein n=1 Tax=Panagrolaimus sp. ES5 TaxID=591445 RepID=A0AC34G3Z7_9BILA